MSQFGSTRRQSPDLVMAAIMYNDLPRSVIDLITLFMSASIAVQNVPVGADRTRCCNSVRYAAPNPLLCPDSHMS